MGSGYTGATVIPYPLRGQAVERCEGRRPKVSGLTVRLNQPFRPRAQVSNIVSNKVVFPFRCLDQDVPRNCSKAKVEFIKVLDITTLNNFYNGDRCPTVLQR